jgi:hypothetical protein
MQKSLIFRLTAGFGTLLEQQVAGLHRAVPSTALDNGYMMAKRHTAFRRAAPLLSKTAWLFCHIFIVMSIAQRIETILCCQTCCLAAKAMIIIRCSIVEPIITVLRGLSREKRKIPRSS